MMALSVWSPVTQGRSKVREEFCWQAGDDNDETVLQRTARRSARQQKRESGSAQGRGTAPQSERQRRSAL